MPRETMQKWDEAREARLADPDNPTLIDAEYAAEREHFRRVREAQSWRRRALTLLIIFAVAAAAWQIRETVVETQDNTAQVHTLTLRLHAALVESCRVNGNAARRVARETLHEEIHKAEHPDKQLIESLHIPPEVLRRLTDESLKTLRERLRRVHAVNCAQQYRITRP